MKKNLLKKIILCTVIATTLLSGTVYASSTWTQSNGTWNLINEQGTKLTGWQVYNGKWYYLNSDGSMATGWKQIGSNWYYLNPNGDMAIGWRQVGDKWYYLNPNGDMAYGTNIGQYVLGSDGAWIVGANTSNSSYIDVAKTAQLNANQGWDRYEIGYPNGKYDDLVQACNNIVLGLPIPDSIKQPWNPEPIAKTNFFQYMGNAVNVVTGETAAYYTRFKEVDNCGGFKHVVAYYDAAIKGYKFYYITIGLFKM